MEKARLRGPEDVSGEPSHLPLPHPGDAWKDAGKRAAVPWLWASCPGPAERGGVGRGVSPAPAPLQSLRGGDLQPPGAGSLQRKSLVLHFQRMLPAAPEVGRLLGGPSSSRLKKPLQGAAVGAGEGQGPEGAVKIRNTPSPRNTHAELVLGPRPWGGLLLLHGVIHELGLLRTFLAAAPGV